MCVSLQLHSIFILTLSIIKADIMDAGISPLKALSLAGEVETAKTMKRELVEKLLKNKMISSKWRLFILHRPFLTKRNYHVPLKWISNGFINDCLQILTLSEPIDHSAMFSKRNNMQF